jgi:hypothetical protein
MKERETNSKTRKHKTEIITSQESVKMSKLLYDSRHKVVFFLFNIGLNK